MKDFTQSTFDMGLTVEEAAEFIFTHALLYSSTKQWTSTDDGSGSCETVRIPVAAIKRLREAINRKTGE